ncbi:methionyl-tRNA formyltransferase [Novosphingobium sp. M1R2S20]|uniref:Methionyl-tRNA formyltransferase n=1 Tax=Novosphingobium rhizovicinum TaxID=3228928 RepID=A0ABV3RGR8_9SPHN
MRAILVGAVDSSMVALDAMMHAPGCQLAAVVTLLPELAGRHSDIADLAGAATRHGVPLLEVKNVNHEDALARLAAVEADYIFVIGWSQICGEAFRALAPGRVIGYHPAALPRLRGRGVIPWTILNAEPITAGSLFWIDDGVDTGEILDQAFFHVAPEETASSLYSKHMEALKTMLQRSLAALANGERPRRKQDERCATFCARRTDADGEIDWSAPADDVLRLIRAVGRPYPGAFTTCRSGEVRVWSAEPVQGGRRHLGAAGQVVARDDTSFTVRCGDGNLVRATEWTSETDRPPILHGRLSRHAA